MFWNKIYTISFWLKKQANKTNKQTKILDLWKVINVEHSCTRWLDQVFLLHLVPHYSFLSNWFIMFWQVCYLEKLFRNEVWFIISNRGHLLIKGPVIWWHQTPYVVSVGWLRQTNIKSCLFLFLFLFHGSVVTHWLSLLCQKFLPHLSSI